MINLYDANETNFNHNGLVVLNDCKTAFVEEELNDKYEVEVVYPIDARGKWQFLTEGNILKADGQLFRIYNKVKTLNGIKINARHIFYGLLDNFVESCSIGNLNAAGALNAILSNTQYAHGFSSMSDIVVSDTYEISKQNPVEAIMADDGVISRYGGELVRDNFTIRLYQARGLDRGVLVAYGKNVIGIEETLNMDSVCTRLLPVGKDGLMLPEKYLDSALINNYHHPIVKSVEFPDSDTEVALRAAGQAYLSQNDQPTVNYKINFIELTKTEEYKNYAILESVYMGDTVTIRHTKLKIDIKAKVIRIKKNLLTNRIEEVELGSFKPNFATGINAVFNTILGQVVTTSSLQAAVDAATAEINNALGGYVLKRNGELLIMDTEDVNTATKVWRWNQGGLGYSGTGYNGPYRTAITADGHIVADFIDTGQLSAGIVKTGTLSSINGKLSIGLDDEVLNIGGKIIYDGATGTLTFAPTVVLSWENLPADVAGLSDVPSDEHITTITRNEIATTTIKIDQLTANDVQNPIIRLFLAGAMGADGIPSDGNPAIDATFNLNEGIGHAIRFKWNDENYIYIATNTLDFYFSDNNGNNRPHVLPDGFYIGSKKIGLPAVNTTIMYKADGTGFDTNLDGTADSWTWSKDANGRITQLNSTSGRIINVTY